MLVFFSAVLSSRLYLRLPLVLRPPLVFHFCFLLQLGQVLGSNAAEAEKLFAGEPETALIASILWAFEVIFGKWCTRGKGNSCPVIG